MISICGLNSFPAWYLGCHAGKLLNIAKSAIKLRFIGDIRLWEVSIKSLTVNLHYKTLLKQMKHLFLFPIKEITDSARDLRCPVNLAIVEVNLTKEESAMNLFVYLV
jgi:hypothetical protein